MVELAAIIVCWADRKASSDLLSLLGNPIVEVFPLYLGRTGYDAGVLLVSSAPGLGISGPPAAEWQEISQLSNEDGLWQRLSNCDPGPKALYGQIHVEIHQIATCV